MKWFLALVLLIPSAVSANSVDNFSIESYSEFGDISFSLPASNPYTGFDSWSGLTFAVYFPFNFDEGVMGGVLEFYSPTSGLFATTGPISFPYDYISDPNKSYYDQWPYDYNAGLPINIGDGVTPMYTVNGNTATFIPRFYYDNLTITAAPTITTPEPSTGLLVLLTVLVQALAFFVARFRSATSSL